MFAGLMAMGGRDAARLMRWRRGFSLTGFLRTVTLCQQSVQACEWRTKSVDATREKEVALLLSRGLEVVVVQGRCCCTGEFGAFGFCLC
jgi:hypothetical protein